MHTRLPNHCQITHWARRSEPTQIVSKGLILDFVSCKNLILGSPGNNVESIFGRRIGICVHWLSSVRPVDGCGFRSENKELECHF